MKQQRKPMLPAALFSIFVIIQMLNQTGFCWRQFRFVSDKEIVARAYRAYLLDSALADAEVDRLVAEAAVKSSECCKVERFHRYSDVWSIASNHWLSFSSAILSRSIGSCWFSVSASNFDLGNTPTKLFDQHIYVEACLEKVTWLKGG